MWDLSDDNFQQWMNVAFTAYEDGRVDSPITLENNTYYGFKGRIWLIIKDATGNRRLA
jgi:hypothetical protein